MDVTTLATNGRKKNEEKKIGDVMLRRAKPILSVQVGAKLAALKKTGNPPCPVGEAIVDVRPSGIEYRRLDCYHTSWS